MSIERYPIGARSAWLQLRLRDLTASDVPAAAGLSPYKTPLQLYAEKTGKLQPAADSMLMRRGRWLESAVIAAVVEQTGWEVQPCRVYLRDPDLRLGATPDAVALTDAHDIVNLQCKVVSKPQYERQWQDGPPAHILLQVATEAMLNGTEAGSWIAALIIDTYSAELELFPVKRHPGAEERIRRIAVEFWDNIANNRRPLVDLERDGDTIKALYPTADADSTVDLSADNYLPGLLSERAELKARISASEKRVEAIDTDITAKLGEAAQAIVPGWRISWKQQTRKAFVVPEKTFRVLRVSELKEEAA